MAISVGGIYAELDLDASGFNAGLKGASTELNRFSTRAGGAGKQLTNTFAGIGRGLTTALGAAGIGAGLSFAALASQVRRVTAEVADLAAQARMAGIGVEAFQELKYAAQQAGVGVDALTDGMKELQLRADEFTSTGKGSAAEAFQRLGYSVDEVKEKLKDPVALFREIIDRLRELNTAAQIRVSDELFGGTAGEQFVRLLSLGRNGVANLQKEARDTGKVLGQDMVKSAEEVNKRFKAMADTVDTQLKRAVLGLVDALRGFASAVATTMSDAFTHVAEVPAAALAKTNQEIAGIRQNIDQLRTTNNLAGVADLDRKLKDAERRRDALMESVREYNRANALSRLGQGPLPPDGAPLPPTRPMGLAGAGAGGVDVPTMAAAASAANDLAEAYARITLGAKERLAQVQAEAVALSMTREAGEAYRFEQDLINQATREGIPLTAGQKQELAGLAQQYAAVKEKIERTREAQEQLNELRGMASGFLTDLRSGLRQGKDAAEAFADAVGNLADKLLQMLQDKLLMELFNALAGGFSRGGSVSGPSSGSIGLYAKGGLVHAARGGSIRGAGTGTSDSIPARLSDGEYVVRAAAVRKVGVPFLDALNSGVRPRLPSFATGGSVGPVPRGGFGGGNVVVNIQNHAGAEVSARERQTSGGRTIEVMIESAINRAIIGGRTDQAMRGRFGMGASLVRRG